MASDRRRQAQFHPITAPAPLPAPPLDDRRRRPHRLLQFDLLVRVAILFTSATMCLLAWFVL